MRITNETRNITHYLHIIIKLEHTIIKLEHTNKIESNEDLNKGTILQRNSEGIRQQKYDNEHFEDLLKNALLDTMIIIIKLEQSKKKKSFNSLSNYLSLGDHHAFVLASNRSIPGNVLRRSNPRVLLFPRVTLLYFLVSLS